MEKNPKEEKDTMYGAYVDNGQLRLAYYFFRQHSWSHYKDKPEDLLKEMQELEKAENNPETDKP
jgi:hypothetical protein